MGAKIIDGMEKVDFDNVTINISDFALVEQMIFRNGTETFNYWPNFSNGELEVTYSGFYFEFLIKCFGLRLKDKKVKMGTFIFDTKMYPDGIRPKLGHPFQPMTYIHLPNQLFLPGNTEKVTWPVRNNNLGVSTSFTITSMDILKGRTKKHEPCTSDAVKYDKQVMKNHVERLGCKPPYLNVFGNYSVCVGKEKLKQAFFDSYVFPNVSIKPCTTLQNINYRYEEAELESEFVENMYAIQIVFPHTFKEIVQVKAVDIQTVIGNAGGYVGLFCGKYSKRTIS